MSLVTDYSDAIWSYPSRTLEAGTPPAPTNLMEEYSDAIWSYVTRTLAAIPDDNVIRYGLAEEDINRSILYEYAIKDLLSEMRSLLQSEYSTVANPFLSNFSYDVLNEYNRSVNSEINNNSPLKNAVLSLQNYVNSQYGDVNAFLLNNDVKVGEYFASVSESVGYIVDQNNIG